MVVVEVVMGLVRVRPSIQFGKEFHASARRNIKPLGQRIFSPKLVTVPGGLGYFSGHASA